MNSEWEIKSRSHVCTKTRREFEEGEMFYTLLFRDREGFRREDLCQAAWEERNDNIQPFSFWRSRYEPPPPPKPETLHKDDAEGLLRELLARGDSANRNAIYILGIMLERKKILRPVASSDPGVLVYEHVETGEVFPIENPGLTIEQIPAVQMEVSALLSGKTLS